MSMAGLVNLLSCCYKVSDDNDANDNSEADSDADFENAISHVAAATDPDDCPTISDNNLIGKRLAYYGACYCNGNHLHFH